MKTTIREYRQGDYETFIFPLVKENMKHYFDRNISGGWSDESHKKEFFQFLKKGFVYVIENKFDPVAYVVFSEDKKIKDSMFINDLQVKKIFQSKGIGTFVINFIEKKASANNYNSVRFYVFKNNPAYKLYCRLDYKEVDFLPESNTRVMEKILGSRIEEIKLK